MKKKLASMSTIALLSVGVVAVLTLSNPEIRSQTIFATARDKQLAWLKEHEEEIIKWMHSVYPKVESVQFDWDTLRVGPVGNGVATVEYNLSVTGTFNNNPDTVIHIDFGLDKSDSIPSMQGIRMNQPPRISRGKVLEIYE
ncbi:hypothetical protein [uncultured Granulicatella sp.]|uniref:hypothetical protein n=1 Tax=uncultured Granulicatella sp. TaxID=316089 RepID=UPI0028049775|nr:hypothetical protein [uncultured Granulicatella sp.]